MNMLVNNEEPMAMPSGCLYNSSLNINWVSQTATYNKFLKRERMKQENNSDIAKNKEFKMRSIIS